jgi:predicted nucleic acid-binding protein
VTETLATLVDTNVLSDVATDNPEWAAWSIQHLETAALKGRLAINDVVYAELSVRFATIEATENFVDDAGLLVVRTPRSALFLAGKAFQRYRTQGGTKTNVLPDFIIGAHAAALGVPLLTRDSRRYRSYFPSLVLIAP